MWCANATLMRGASSGMSGRKPGRTSTRRPRPGLRRKAGARRFCNGFLTSARGIRFEIAKFRWGQTNLAQIYLWALVPVLAFLLYQIVFRRKRKRGSKTKTGKTTDVIFWPGLDSEFYALERRLAARGGVPRSPAEPLAGWLARSLDEPALADLRKSVAGIVAAALLPSVRPRWFEATLNGKHWRGR